MYKYTPSAWILAPWVLYRHATTAVTLLCHTENELWKIWIMNGALKPIESHHSSTSLIYTVITLSTLAQQNRKVPESLTITPFSENSENSKLKLSCFRSLFLEMKKQPRVYHKKASTPSNQNITLFILPQISGTRVRLSYPPQVGSSKNRFFEWWDEEGS